MTHVYEHMEHTLIPNTTMHKVLRDGETLTNYFITPNDGYVLHDKILDVDTSDDRNPDGGILLGYYPVGRTCGDSYDFGNTKTIDGYTAYGEREFFARPISEVPEAQRQGSD